MKALIIEDEKMAQILLRHTLEMHFPDIEVVYVADSVRSAVDYLSLGPNLDVIFMDVELSDGNCFEIFRNVDVKSRVIMTTAYDSYAIKAFEAGSIDYLLKPISLDALKRAVNRVRERSGLSDVATLLAAMPQPQCRETFTVRSGDKIIPITASEIALLFSEDKANYLMNMEGFRFIIDSTLDQLEKEIDPDKFFRISRSCIIARKSIESVSRLVGSRMKVLSKPSAPVELSVSRARVHDFLKWLG